MPGVGAAGQGGVEEHGLGKRVGGDTRGHPPQSSGDGRRRLRRLSWNFVRHQSWVYGCDEKAPGGEEKEGEEGEGSEGGTGPS